MSQGCHVRILNPGRSAQDTVIFPAEATQIMGLGSKAAGLIVRGYIGAKLVEECKQALARTRAKDLIVFVNTAGGDSELNAELIEHLKRYQGRTGNSEIRFLVCREALSCGADLLAEFKVRQCFSMPKVRFLIHFGWHGVPVLLTISQDFIVYCNTRLDTKKTENQTDRLMLGLAVNIHRCSQVREKVETIQRDLRADARRSIKLWRSVARKLGHQNTHAFLCGHRYYKAEDLVNILVSSIVPVSYDTLPTILRKPVSNKKLAADLDISYVREAGGLLHCW